MDGATHGYTDMTGNNVFFFFNLGCSQKRIKDHNVERSNYGEVVGGQMNGLESSTTGSTRQLKNPGWMNPGLATIN